MLRAFLLSFLAMFSQSPAQLPVNPVVPVPTVALVSPSQALPASLSAGTIMRLPWNEDNSSPATAPAALYQSDELAGTFDVRISDVATASGQGDVVLTSLIPDRLLISQKTGLFTYLTSQILSVKFGSTLVEFATASAQINLNSRYPTIKVSAGSAKFAQVGSDDLPHLYFLKSGQIVYFTPWGIYVY